MGALKPPLSRRLTGYALGYTLLVLIADQYTKWMILYEIMVPPQHVPIMPFVSFDLVWNKGVTFGLLHNNSDLMPYAFAVLALAIIGWLLTWLWRTSNRWIALGIGLIIGGAIGNIIDRFRFGAVVDFIHISFYPWIFNVADSAVVIGVGILLLESLLSRRSG